MLQGKLRTHPNFERLQHRKEGFEIMAAHVEREYSRGRDIIIETGTARQFNNWEGDGQSTLIWDFFTRILTSLAVLSIDINDEAVFNASIQVSNKVKFCIGDSLKVLPELSDSVLARTSLLYLDSFDWTPELQEASSEHHLKELLAVWERLPIGTLVVVDDCHSKTQGKHTAVAAFFVQQNIQPLFVGYQTGWIKR